METEETPEYFEVGPARQIAHPLKRPRLTAGWYSPGTTADIKEF